MSRALSVDLRKRVIAAVEEGASCRQAAARFGGAIRWHPLFKAVGDATARQQGGDRRSARIEAHAAAILGALERKSDITLADLRDELAGHEVGVSVAGLWRFFQRRRITLKKVWPTPSARVMLDDVLVCIDVSGLRAGTLAKMDRARLGPHKDMGVEHHIFDQALATRGQPLRYLSFTSTDIMSGVDALPAAVPGQAAMAA